MTTLFAALASSLAYLAVLVLVARRTYARVRPYSEPLNCDRCILCDCSDGLGGSGRNGHCYEGNCWKRPGGVTYPAAAVSWALADGLLWPVLLLYLFLLRPLGHAASSVITSGAPVTAEEREAKISRLERDLHIGERL